MEKEQFLKGIKEKNLCDRYARKFKNTYSQYLESEDIERQNFMVERNIDNREFETQYKESWNDKWFYIGPNINSFYNEMSWDFTKLSSNKDLLYSMEAESYYKDYVIQDIWDHFMKETDCEYLCWGVYNFIQILRNTDEQQSFKKNLQLLMDELYQCGPGENETSNEGKLSAYIKKNGGIKCAFGHIKIDIRNRLGQGGNGVVYSGLLGKTTVAVKFLVNYTEAKLERFKAEYIDVNIVRQKLHHTVNYLHYETLILEDCQIPFIIMEKYNTSLKHHRKEMEQVTWEDLIKLFDDLCDALKSLEHNSITHRDLKPENILVDDDGNYILTDFGIAHFESEKYPIIGLTQKNDRLANWEFSAPEQARGGEISNATDIYALGQILYWFCFNTTIRGTGGRHLQELFENEKAPLLDSILYQSISIDPQNRYQSIEEIETAFAGK